MLLPSLEVTLNEQICDPIRHGRHLIAIRVGEGDPKRAESLPARIHHFDARRLLHARDEHLFRHFVPQPGIQIHLLGEQS